MRLRRFEQSEFRRTRFRRERTGVGTAAAARVTPAPTDPPRAVGRVQPTRGPAGYPASSEHCPNDNRHSGQDERRGFVTSQRGRCDAEEAQLRSKDRLFLKLVVTNAIVASDHDPASRSRLCASRVLWRCSFSHRGCRRGSQWHRLPRLRRAERSRLYRTWCAGDAQIFSTTRWRSSLRQCSLRWPGGKACERTRWNGRCGFS